MVDCRIHNSKSVHQDFWLFLQLLVGALEKRCRLLVIIYVFFEHPLLDTFLKQVFQLFSGLLFSAHISYMEGISSTFSFLHEFANCMMKRNCTLSFCVFFNLLSRASSVVVSCKIKSNFAYYPDIFFVRITALNLSSLIWKAGIIPELTGRVVRHPTKGHHL